MQPTSDAQPLTGGILLRQTPSKLPANVMLNVCWIV